MALTYIQRELVFKKMLFPLRISLLNMQNHEIEKK